MEPAAWEDHFPDLVIPLVSIQRNSFPPEQRDMYRTILPGVSCLTFIIGRKSAVLSCSVL